MANKRYPRECDKRKDLISRRSFLRNILAAGGSSAVTLSAGSILGPVYAHYQAPNTCTWPTSTSISPSGAPNQLIDLPYSAEPFIQAKLALNVDGEMGVSLTDIFDGGALTSGNDMIVTNLGGAYAEITLSLGGAEGIAKSLPPRKAAVISGEVRITKATSAETPTGGDPSAPLHMAFIRTSSPRNLANVLSDTSKWQSYTTAGCWPDGVGPYPLWMSTRAEITKLNLSFDPWRVSGQETPSGEGKRQYDIHSNLWWLPAFSDAAVHHCHYANFLEVHTQLFGVGRMQKFTDSVNRGNCPSPETFDMPVTMPPPASSFYGVPGILDMNMPFLGMYEEYRLSPGDTNVPFAYVDSNAKFIYPWHQYYADTDCLWVVWEMIPTGEFRRQSS